MATCAALLVLASLLQQGFCPDKPGEWKQTVEPDVPREYAVAPAQSAAFDKRLGTLLGVLHRAPVFQPPLGFQPRARARWFEPEPCRARPAFCRTQLVQAQAVVTLYYFVADEHGQPSWGGEANTAAEIWVNSPEASFVSAGTYDVMGAPWLLLPDGRHVEFMPRKTQDLAGFPLYDDQLLVLTRSSRPYWIPVTRAEYLQALVRHTEGELARDEARLGTPTDPYQQFLSKREERRSAREKTYQAIKASSPARAEEFLRTSLKMEADIEAGLKARAPSTAMIGDPRQLERDLIASLRATLADMPPAERQAQAWIRFRAPQEGEYYRPLVPAGTAEASPLVAFNPAFFDRSLPRTDWQLLTVRLLSDGRYRSPSFIGGIRLRQLVESADWPAVAALLASPRAAPPARP